MSLGLTQGQLDLMRAQVAQLLPDMGTIAANSRASDGAGGWTDHWLPISGGTVAVRVDPYQLRRFTENFADREGIVNLYTVTLPYDAPVDVGQQIWTNDMTLEVREYHSKNSWRTQTQVIAAEIK
jgi:hypothetical protein